MALVFLEMLNARAETIWVGGGGETFIVFFSRSNPDEPFPSFEALKSVA